MSIDFFSRSGSTLPSPIVAISGWFISSLSVWTKRSRSTGTLISGSRLATAATAGVDILQRVDQALVDRAHQARDRLRIFLHQLLRDDDGVGIEVHAVVAVVDEAELAVLHAHQLGGEADGVDVAEHAVDLALHQHLLAQVGLHVGDA